MSKPAKILNKLNISLKNIKRWSFIIVHVPLSLLSIISGAVGKYFCLQMGVLRDSLYLDAFIVSARGNFGVCLSAPVCMSGRMHPACMGSFHLCLPPSGDAPMHLGDTQRGGGLWNVLVLTRTCGCPWRWQRPLARPIRCWRDCWLRGSPPSK